MQYYRRALAAANPEIGWAEIPTCPMPIFAKIMAMREQDHPEVAAMLQVETRARVFNECAWKSEKVLNIKPAEWIPEYSWLYSIALADGTFEASPRQIWMAAYALRPDWTIDKVGKLLDELERVGLLERATDENGKVWARWIGSEKFLPTKESMEAHRYKQGRFDLFPKAQLRRRSAAPSSASAVQSSAELRGLGLGLGVGSGLGKGTGIGTGFDSAAKDSENENCKSKPASNASVSNSKPKNRRTAVLSPDDYMLKRDEEETAALVAAAWPNGDPRPLCAKCGLKHWDDPNWDCTKKKSVTDS